MSRMLRIDTPAPGQRLPERTQLTPVECAARGAGSSAPRYCLG